MILTQIAQVTLDIKKAAHDAEIPGADAADPSAAFGEIVSGILSVLLYVGALMVLMYLIWGAYEWITSKGDSGNLQKARMKITHAILGLIVLSSILVIFALVQNFLGVCFIDFGGSSCGGGKKWVKKDSSADSSKEPSGSSWLDGGSSSLPLKLIDKSNNITYSYSEVGVRS